MQKCPWSRSIKALQNFQKVKPCMIEKYKPLQSSSAQKCWAFKANGHWSKVNKAVKVPLCSERGLNPKSKVTGACICEKFKGKLSSPFEKLNCVGESSHTWPFRSLWYIWSKYDRGTVSHTKKFESSAGTISRLKFGNDNSIGLLCQTYSFIGVQHIESARFGKSWHILDWNSRNKVEKVSPFFRHCSSWWSNSDWKSCGLHQRR